MPTYEYLCRDQGHRLEVQQKFTDEPLTVCPICGGSLRKVISAPPIVFKGSGFYRNDSRAKSSRGSSSAARDKDGGSADGAKSGSESAKESASTTSGGDSSTAASKTDGAAGSGTATPKTTPSASSAPTT